MGDLELRARRAELRARPPRSRPAGRSRSASKRQTTEVTPGCRAAVEVAAELELVVDEPLLIQETNNTVIWLRPHPIIAKVGTHPDSGALLVREHEVASALAALGAPAGAPLTGVAPLHHLATGFIVTLWQRLEHDVTSEPADSMVAASLQQLHAALALIDIELPSFRVGLQRARTALFDDVRMNALAVDDRAFLRSAFDGLVAELDSRVLGEQSLHGEPHDGNLLVTRSGLRWIDFESTCRGPLEWDLAFLGGEPCDVFGGVDLELLELLATLNSARVATWCWIQARFPDMRWHAEHHLGIVRSRTSTWRE